MKKEKSLRQLAKELGVSPSYLSQVKNGKRPPSRVLLSSLHKVLSKLTTVDLTLHRQIDTIFPMGR